MVRLQVPGHHGDEFRQLQHLANERNLRLVNEDGRISVGVVDATLARNPENSNDARVGVLDVIDRILLRPFLCQLDVELHLAFWRPLQEEESAGVGADFFHEIADGHHLSRPLREPDGLSGLLQGNELIDEEYQTISLDAKHVSELLHELNLPLVIRAPDIDYPVESAHDELVVVVCHVGGKVGRSPVAADEHLVLIIPEFGRGEPRRPVPFDQKSTLLEHVHGSLELAVVEQASFAKPDVVAYLDVLHVRADGLDHATHPNLSNLRYCGATLHVEVLAAVLAFQLPREIDQILPLVSVTGQLCLSSELLDVPRIEALVETIHLASGVVDVILALDLVSRGFQDACERASEDRPPPVSDMNRPGWVDAYELHLHPRALAIIDDAKGLTRLTNRIDLRSKPLGAQAEVHEAGASGHSALENPAGLGRCRDRLRDVEWSPTHQPGKLHRRR